MNLQMAAGVVVGQKNFNRLIRIESVGSNFINGNAKFGGGIPAGTICEV
jgi:hypothetical protein